MRAGTHVQKRSEARYVAAQMPEQLLNLLRDEAVTLNESETPGPAELSSLVGAIVKRLERLEQDVVGELKPAPAPELAPAPTVANSVQPDAPGSEAVIAQAQAEAQAAQAAQAQAEQAHADQARQLEQAQADLAAAQARVTELEAGSPDSGNTAMGAGSNT